MKYNLPEGVEEAIPQILPPGIKRHHLYHIVDQIWYKCLFNNRRKKKAGGFIPLKACSIQNGIRNYKQHIEYLISLHIIETDSHYDTLRHIAKGYKITRKFLSALPRIVEIGKAEPKYHTPEEITKKHPIIKKYANGFTFPYDEGLRFIQDRFNKECQKFDDTPYSGVEQLVEAAKRVASKRLSHAMFSLQKFKENRHNFTIGEMNNRLTSTEALAQKDIRAFFLYKGERIASVDIKNSQPYFSIALINMEISKLSERQKKEAESHDTLKIFDNYSSFINCNLSLEYSTLSSLSSQSSSSLQTLCYERDAQMQQQRGFSPSTMVYKNLVESGQFYEYLDYYYCLKYGKKFKDRKALKQEVFLMLYSKNKVRTQLKMIFKEHFPQVHEIFLKYKRNHYNKLAIALQIIESNFMLEHVMPYVGKSIPCFPVHDCLMVPETMAELCRRIMIDKLEKLVRAKPTISIDYFEQMQVT
jgi:hypothetical protein